MEWLVRLYRLGSSSPVALAILIVVNAVPIAGVLLWGWSLWSILILYWLENGIVGLLNVARIILARGDGDSGAAKIAMVPFFLLHYGIFWTVHGAFILFGLPAFANVGSSGSVQPAVLAPAVVAAGPNWDAIRWAALGLAISHGASFFLNYVGRREYLTATVGGQFVAPYARVVILHVSIIVGAFVSAALGNPIGALVVLVVLKTAIDIALHLREHTRAAGPAVARSPTPGVA